MPTNTLTLRQKTANILDDNSRYWLSRVINFVIITTIAITVLAIILESEPSLHPKYTKLFKSIDNISLLIFTIEYLCRVWAAPDMPQYKNQSAWRARWIYMRSFHAIIDLLAILPLFLSLFSIDLRFLRVVRLLRIFKLTRYSSAMNTLLLVFKSEARAFFSVIFVLIIVLIISSSCIYLLEHKTQPEAFGSILQSMWWSIVTLATVGYGDVSPVTPMGKLFAGIIMIVGVGLVALPAGLLASGFSEQLHKNKADYRNAIKIALHDGVITPEEHQFLHELQEKYDIDPEDAEAMIQAQLAALRSNNHVCPHCGERLN
ncbi:MAG: Ion transport protein [Gammaproteobacteria bacterium]|nr:MAG: Ion transport protein [Gammaproteobacteria bacterium]